MRKLLLLLSLFTANIIEAQIYLKPSIGVTSQPLGTENICTIPVYTGSFYTSGLQVGDTAYDFKLYDLNGDSIVLSEILLSGKPLLIVNGSYTCPVFRNKVAMINQVASTYAGLINVVIIYTVEAHPTDISPYFGFINTGTANINAGILFAQPATYQTRKNIVDTMVNTMNINVPVYIDAPCNPWWSAYGPAPNNAYLIQPNGIIFAKHGWFDKNPIDYIVCDIDSLLYGTPCSLVSGAGNFSILQIDTTVVGAPGSILYGYTDVINNSSSTVTVGVKKLQKNYPVHWQTAFCADVCYSPNEDSITFTIPPNDTMHFSIDFITSAIVDSGSIKIGFRNANNISNQFAINVKAKTTIASSINDIKKVKWFDFYPNPTSNQLFLTLHDITSIGANLDIFNIFGKKVFSQRLNAQQSNISVASLPVGIYMIKVGNQVSRFVRN